MEDLLIGALGALGSMLFFGTYAVFIKPASLEGVTVNPLVFQTYKSVACFATSWLVLLYVPFKFTWWGVLGAGLWVFTGLGSIIAVRLAGIGPTQSIWSGLSILVSYIWGAYVFHEPVKHHLLALMSVMTMVAGMVGVAFAASEERNLHVRLSKAWTRWRNSPGLLKSVFKQPLHSPEDVNGDDSASKGLIRGGVDEDGMEDGMVDEGRVVHSAQARFNEDDRFLLGVGAAVVVGVLNGSFMVPLAYANKDVVGIAYVVSFGIGAIVFVPLLLAVYCLVNACQGQEVPSFQFSVVAFPALATGIFWSAGNFCSIYATLYLGVSLGWPLVQCQLLVSAMWAVFYFKEVTNTKSIVLLVSSSLLVVAGAVALSTFGIAS